MASVWVTVTPVRGVTGDELRVSARSSSVNVAGSIAWENVTSTPWTGWLVGLVTELIAVTVGPWTVKVPVRWRRPVWNWRTTKSVPKPTTVILNVTFCSRGGAQGEWHREHRLVLSRALTQSECRPVVVPGPAVTSQETSLMLVPGRSQGRR